MLRNPIEAFYEYLGSSTNILTKNIDADKNNTITSSQKLRKNKDIVILSADKDSRIAILNKMTTVNLMKSLETVLLKGNTLKLLTTHYLT